MKKQIDLDALVAEDGGEVVLGGVPHRVLPISGASIDKLAGGTNLRGLYDVAATCVPSLAREALDALTPKQVQAIIDLASADALAVEQQEAKETADPNGAAPAGSPTASPA